jgi:uncharacterized protein
MYPSSANIQTLHHTYAPNEKIFDLVFTHCQIVEELARQIIADQKLMLNTELVRAGALLHDIGSYVFMNPDGTFDHENYMKHAKEGSTILRQQGLPEDVCRIVERHIGVGITEKDIIAQKLDLPLKDYSPKTIEERLVLYADKFHSKYPRFNSYETYHTFTKKFGEENQRKFERLAEEFGKPNLEILVAKYQHPLV